MIRKLLTVVEETHQEAGQTVRPATRKAAAIAVIWNPYAGRRADDLSELIDVGEDMGAQLGQRAVAALGISPDAVESYGKAAIVGEDGELEHAAAILHPKLGAPLRQAVEHGAALVPSAKKRGTLGTPIDVPLTRTPPSCAATSTPWKSVSPTPPAATKSSSPSWSPTAAAPSRASAA
jgi:hypothetical protein